MICVDSVSRSYRSGGEELLALDGVSLEVERGEFVALMGPSGSGKSTLLNILSGLDSQTAGTVVVGGQDLGQLDEGQRAAWRARSVGLVFQFFNLIPVLSAWENVALPLLLRKLPKAARRERAEVALRIVGLSERARHRPTTMSGGEQQRVAIARALVVDPGLIIADEPTGDLDARNAEAVLDLLRVLKSEFGKTIVMVTHDARALSYVDRVVHLDKGVLVPEQEAYLPEAHVTRAIGQELAG